MFHIFHILPHRGVMLNIVNSKIPPAKFVMRGVREVFYTENSRFQGLDKRFLTHMK